MYPGFGGPQHQPGAQYVSERQAHISDLISNLPAFKPVNRDKSVLEGPARLADGQTINLRVTLPPNFPQIRPILGVGRPLRHPLLDDAGQLSFPSLSQWNQQHSRLSLVVRDGLNGLAQRQLPSPQRSAVDTSPSRAATAPKSFPELEAYPTERLEELCTNHEAYQKLLNSHVDMAQPRQVMKLLARGNIDLAQANLDREAELAEVKNQIAIIRSSEYATAKEAFDSAYTRQEAVLTKIKPQALINALALKAAEADESAENLAEAFMRKEATVEVFLPAFIGLKKKVHQRELKQQAAEQIL